MSNFLIDWIDIFGSGAFPYAGELQCLGMALQSALNVRSGPNRDGNLHWFHAFCLTVLGGFGGGIIGFVWLGLPSGFFTNDLAMGSCIIAFILVNYTPADIGYKVLKTLPATMAFTVFAQLFRSKGVTGFTNTSFNLMKDNPSEYYPIPIFGPIMYATLLGNWGAFVLKGFNGHIANGIPWPVQNGLFCSTFYHFFANDTKGPIGRLLRTSLPLVNIVGFSDDRKFALAVVTVFMQIMGQLQLPAFLGPSFTPFGSRILSPFRDSSTWTTGTKETVYSKVQAEKKQRKRGRRNKKSSTGNGSNTNGDKDKTV